MSPTEAPMGFLSTEPEALARRIVRGWELFSHAVDEVDLAGRTRSKKRRAREMVIGLGTWPDSRGIPGIVADAQAGATTTEPFDQASGRLSQSHSAASDEEVRASVTASLEQSSQWLDNGVLAAHGGLPTPSPLGLLPVGTVMHMAVYQLAITARDLIPAGASPHPELDQIGLMALLDASAAVAARMELVATASAVGESVAVSIDVADGGWTTSHGDDPSFPGVFGPEGLMLDLAGGRAELALLMRRLRFRNPRGMLALAPVVDDVPDLPGGPLLRQAARWARLFGK